MTPSRLTLDDLRAARRQLDGRIVTTPVHELDGPMVEAALAPGTRVLLKLELLQCTGSFMSRGALINVLRLGPDERRRGVCMVSAGNHAIATAYAASCLGISARVVMPASANPLRIARCRLYGAEVELAPDIHAAFRRLEEIRGAEGRALIHPFEGPEVALGTGTLGLEWLEQAPDLEAVIVPIGGGGLAAGLSAAIKLLKPGCEVIGVEPFGADTMYQSRVAGRPVGIERVATIADSLGAPFALPWSFALCQAHVDDLVRVDDAELVVAMRFLMEQARLAVEPAGAAATAALLGPLRTRLAGRRVGVMVSGTNLDAGSYARLIAG